MQKWWIHTREKESLASVSMHATATSATTRYLQCSSSMPALSLGGKDLGGDDVGEGQKPLGESDEFRAASELIVHNTTFISSLYLTPSVGAKVHQRKLKMLSPCIGAVGCQPLRLG